MINASLTAEPSMVEIHAIEWDAEHEAVSLVMSGEPTEAESRLINELMVEFAAFLGREMESAGEFVREWIDKNGGIH